MVRKSDDSVQFGNNVKMRNELIYMYTFHPDLVATSNCHLTRDQDLFRWMMVKNIALYPKSLQRYERDREKLEQRSREHPETVLFFCRKDPMGELYCEALQYGMWTTHPSMLDAQRSVMNIPSRQPVRLTFLKYDSPSNPHFRVH